MNKSGIKDYAKWARRELILRVSQRAELYGITEKGWEDPAADSVHGKILTVSEKRQRRGLIAQIGQKGYEEVMEEAAYTWFNRFCALRFMEVNGYLPSHVRVFTDDENGFKPQILAEAIHLELDGLDMERVYVLKNGNQNEELFKYLIITQCNALNSILPGIFQKIEDYTELLFPDHLLREGSMIQQMVAVIPEEDWKDQVQIIGWLYQYYNSEKKDKVFAALKKNVKITRENIPAATQLFTPDWIVRYMVENSLGRLWVEGHPDEELKGKWKYYLEEAKQEPEVEKQLKEIRREYEKLNPEDIRCIDPCMGSGHILCYMFDVLVQIYEAHGVQTRDAVRSIVEKNLYGLDIDDRAAQLAYFSVMMTGRKYDGRFFRRGVQPHVYGPKGYEEGREFGALLTVEKLEEMPRESEELSLFDESYEEKLNRWWFRKVLAGRYDVVCTNPPYMAVSNGSDKIQKYVKKNYPDSKSDLFACFMERCGKLAKKNGYQAMITQHAWMFLSSYEKLRRKLQVLDTVNMAHLGARAFEEIGGEVVQTTSFVMRRSCVKGYRGTYCRLIEPTTQQGKKEMFLGGENRYVAEQGNFEKIPGGPVAYWASKNIQKAFSEMPLYNKSLSPSQNVTGNNAKFVRKHWEIEKEKIGGYDSWIFYAKGGGYRKWWGNLIDIVNWTPRARYIYQHGDGKHASQIINKEYWYKKGITWGLITSSLPSFRIMPEGATYDKGGSTIIVSPDIYNFTLGLLNSKVYVEIASMLNPTLNFQVKDIRSMPLILENLQEINKVVDQCVSYSKYDWDSFETSWEFKKHPLV